MILFTFRVREKLFSFPFEEGERNWDNEARRRVESSRVGVITALCVLYPVAKAKLFEKAD
jgi:hypothetical protein